MPASSEDAHQSPDLACQGEGVSLRTRNSCCMSVHVERGVVFVQKAAAPCKQPPSPSPLTTGLPAAFAEQHLPPQLSAHQTSSPLWMLLVRAQQGGQRKDQQHKGVLGTALHQLLLLISLFFAFFFFFPRSWGDICHFNFKEQNNKTPTMTKPAISGVGTQLVGTVKRGKTMLLLQT